jgi:MFS family permease
MSDTHPNQFALLAQRRFAPFFWTQFLGAANDNLFKFALTVMVTYQLQVSWLPPSLAGLVIGAVFIFPFLLFSATSGQLTDKWDKTRMIRFVKNFEVAVMLLAAFGFYAAHVPVLLVCVFLMGLHSTLFGPVKFAYLPQVLSEREITGGNGMVEMGTFVAICVLSLWTLEQMTTAYRISEAECIGLLARLDRIGIIELRAHNRYTLKLAKTFKWRPHGPVMQFFREHAVQDYFSGGFNAASEGLLLVHGQVSKAAAPLFLERIQRLAQDFSNQHLQDQKLRIDQREGYTLLLAMRQWDFSVFAALKRA